jgi:hypothetical protein
VWAGGWPKPFSGFYPPRSATQGSSFLATQGLNLGSLRDALRFALVTPNVAWCLATQGLKLGSLRDALRFALVTPSVAWRLATQGLKLGSLRDALRFALVTPG